MSTVELRISADDFFKSTYDEIINNCDKNECQNYATKFLQRARVLESESDLVNSEIFTLIGRLSSLNLKSESALQPFSPIPSEPIDIETQSFTQIFSREHLDLLKDIAPKVMDFELQARIADVMWVIDRDYKMAEIAIDAYLESAKKLENPEHWTSCEQRIQRAFRLSNLLGKKAGHVNKVLAHIESVLEKYNGEDPLFLSERLMSLLIEAKHGNSDKYSIISEKCAIDAEKKIIFIELELTGW